MNSKYYLLEKLNENINIEFQKFNIYFQVIYEMDLMDRIKFVKDTFKNNDDEYNKTILETLIYFIDMENKDKFVNIMIEFIKNVINVVNFNIGEEAIYKFL